MDPGITSVYGYIRQNLFLRQFLKQPKMKTEIDQSGVIKS